ncbi:hypothetical protein CBL_20112, partial [Carabus blaptoides fortunei]
MESKTITAGLVSDDDILPPSGWMPLKRRRRTQAKKAKKQNTTPVSSEVETLDGSRQVVETEDGSPQVASEVETLDGSRQVAETKDGSPQLAATPIERSMEPQDNLPEDDVITLSSDAQEWSSQIHPDDVYGEPDAQEWSSQDEPEFTDEELARLDLFTGSAPVFENYLLSSKNFREDNNNRHCQFVNIDTEKTKFLGIGLNVNCSFTVE